MPFVILRSSLIDFPASESLDYLRYREIPLVGLIVEIIHFPANELIELFFANELNNTKWVVRRKSRALSTSLKSKDHLSLRHNDGLSMGEESYKYLVYNG